MVCQSSVLGFYHFVVGELVTSEEYTSQCDDKEINKLKISCTSGCIMINYAHYRCDDIAGDDTKKLKQMCNNKPMCIYDPMKIIRDPGEPSCYGIISVTAL